MGHRAGHFSALCTVLGLEDVSITTNHGVIIVVLFLVVPRQILRGTVKTKGVKVYFVLMRQGKVRLVLVRAIFRPRFSEALAASAFWLYNLRFL